MSQFFRAKLVNHPCSHAEKTKTKPLFKHNKQVNNNSEYAKIWQLKKIHDKNFLEGQIILVLCVFCIQFICKGLYLFLALLAQCDAFPERILVLGTNQTKWQRDIQWVITANKSYFIWCYHELMIVNLSRNWDQFCFQDKESNQKIE